MLLILLLDISLLILKGMINMTLVNKVYRNDKNVIIYKSIMGEDLYFNMIS